MSVASDTAEQIGWHRHGVAWVWGIRAYDQCDLCDAAEHWLSKQVDIDDLIKHEIRSRRAVHAEPSPTQYIDPHAPQELPPEAAPSLDKIKRGKKPKVEPVAPPSTPQIDLLSTVAANETEEDAPLPPPVAPVTTFKLTNPDQYTLKKVRRKR